MATLHLAWRVILSRTHFRGPLKRSLRSVIMSSGLKVARSGQKRRTHSSSGSRIRLAQSARRESFRRNPRFATACTKCGRQGFPRFSNLVDLVDRQNHRHFNARSFLQPTKFIAVVQASWSSTKYHTSTPFSRPEVRACIM